MGSCGEPGGEGTVESPTAGLSTGPRDRALHAARSRRPLPLPWRARAMRALESPEAKAPWRARAMKNCGEPGGEGTVESPAAGLSKRPRDRALHEARAAGP